MVVLSWLGYTIYKRHNNCDGDRQRAMLDLKICMLRYDHLATLTKAQSKSMTHLICLVSILLPHQHSMTFRVNIRWKQFLEGIEVKTLTKRKFTFKVFQHTKPLTSSNSRSNKKQHLLSLFLSFLDGVLSNFHSLILPLVIIKNHWTIVIFSLKYTILCCAPFTFWRLKILYKKLLLDQGIHKSKSST